MGRICKKKKYDISKKKFQRLYAYLKKMILIKNYRNKINIHVIKT